MAWTHTRSQIALIKKADPAADVSELRQRLKAERLEDHVKRTVSSAPPLSVEQRDRIAALLRPNARDGGGQVA